MQVSVRVLGEIEVVARGAPRSVGSRSQRVVIATLASRPGRVVAADVLIDALWGDAPPPTALRTLRTYISRLRQVLGDHLEGTAGGYRLDLPPAALDIARFEELLDAAAVAPSGGLVELEDALALWRGRPFGDVDDLAVLRPVAGRLTERWVDAREAHAGALLAVGRTGEAVACATELVEDHPLREGAWAVLVRALAAAGRTTEALRAHRRAAEVLAEAGLVLGPVLQQAEADVVAGTATAPPPPGGGSVRRLDGPTIELVGRDGDRRSLGDLLERSRLVTLVGPGGVGKTQLALAVAADAQERFAWGARIVELASIEDPAQVAPVVVGSLGVEVGAGGVDAALDAAADLDLLVVLDNCEHVAAAAAVVARRLTSRGSGLHVLATSREPLAVQGEHRWPVAPLAADGDASAVRLFLDRARAASPSFAPDAEELEHVRSLCRQLDGLPLAIEMAAGALGVLPLGELVARLAGDGALPSSRRRDVEARHQDLGELVAWSTRLLEPDDRALLHDLAPVAGWVGADDVASVTGRPEPLDGLCRLAERSLLATGVAGGRARFRLLHTVRRGITPPDGVSADARERHARWVAGAVAEADAGLRSRAERAAHRRVEQLLDDARSAMAWALDHDPTLAVELAGHLALYGQSRHRDEVMAWAAAAARHAEGVRGAAAAAALALAAHQALNAGATDAGLALAERAVAAADGPAPAIAHEVLSDAHLFAGDAEACRAAAVAGQQAARAVGDRYGEALCTVNAVLSHAYSGDHAGAEAALEQGRALADVAPSAGGWLTYAEGERLLDRDPTAALDALDRAIAIAVDVGNRYLEAVARVSATSVRSRTGDPHDQRSAFVEVIDHWRRHGDRAHLLTTLRNLVVLLDRLRLDEAAAELLGTVLDPGVSPSYGDERRLLDDVGHRLARRLGAPELERRLAAGRARSVDDAARLARDLLAGSAKVGRWST